MSSLQIQLVVVRKQQRPNPCFPRPRASSNITSLYSAPYSKATDGCKSPICSKPIFEQCGPLPQQTVGRNRGSSNESPPRTGRSFICNARGRSDAQPGLGCGYATLVRPMAFRQTLKYKHLAPKERSLTWREVQSNASTRHRTSMAIVGAAATRALWTILMGCAAAGQVLERSTTWGARMSAPLLSLLLGMLLSSLGIVPAASPAYDAVWQMVMPLAVALTLLETDVRRAFSDAGAALTAFWLGAMGTVLGVLLAYAMVGPSLGPEGWKMASCLCASYIGGSINYAATAQALGFGSGGMLAAGMAADNLLMALYFGAVMAMPDSWQTRSPERPPPEDAPSSAAPEVGEPLDAGPAATVESLAVSLATAGAACVIGQLVASRLPASFAGVELGLTAVLASLFSAAAAAYARGQGEQKGSPRVNIFAGSETLGGALMLLFFSTVGASAGFQEAAAAGWKLLAFGFILLSTHLAVILSLGRAVGLPLDAILVASNANVGGPATAAAMASARSWPHLVRPALLTGTLGYTVGTAIGCLVGLRLLQPIALMRLVVP